MDCRTTLIAFTFVLYVNAFSKYGRTCKDIGCLNSEVCVLAEDPCTFGQHSNCGSYPTCKKKSKVEGSHSEPAHQPDPKPQTPTRDFDSPPSYPAPAPPSNTHGGNSPYGDNSPYGGGSPYGSSGGNNNPIGTNGGNSPYGSNPYGGNSPYGVNPPYGSNSPYGGSSNRGGNSPYGGSNPNPSSNTGFGSGGKGPIDSLLNTFNNFANGGHGTPGGSSGQGLSNFVGGLLGNLSKTGGLNNFFNTRPIMENPNYSSYSSNSRSANTQNYPSGNNPAPIQPTQNRNYGQNYGSYNGAYTRKPSYGWNVSLTVILTYLIRQYIYGVIRD